MLNTKDTQSPLELAKERRRVYNKRYYAQNTEKCKALSAAVTKRSPSKNLKRKYNITAGEYEEILHFQNSCCAICKQPWDNPKPKWHVDHCHETGFVRGVLCHGCNVGIGQLRDDPAIIRSALSYLDKHKNINALH